jgi:beta-galactosidase
MAVVQSGKEAGSITVQAASPGFAPATVTISARKVSLRPQIAVWKREVPVGSGVTGFWRPIPEAAGSNEPLSSFMGAESTLFTLRQSGNSLTGSVEGGGGNQLSAPIEDGRIEGGQVSFKAGNSTYAGTVTADRISLERKIEFPFRRPQPAAPTGPQPAIGPPPDGSDPSFNRSRRLPESIPVVLHRVER